ncbi:MULTISPECIES: ABC transporter permease [unclassified Arthrobacter]|uniref:ABC transporter permease n=1 Tax=unclassified Arthrobacter TaxID=235627 RepID=UPI001D1541BC|nr:MULTISPECIES: ABC transporter permease [unclassified Arthrobacter]MCC3302139.1 ABC transporter permease [Arthrobacter sp. zg-Y895]MCQ1947557.1 ABC transporter permease [Arthrobacter sp. zg-Y1116]MCQ1987509.1 ABC transporter permease [Arthrobacter sp. zg-Y844]
MTNTATAPKTTDSSELDGAIRREYRQVVRLRYRDILLSTLTPVLLLALWEVAARNGALDARLFTPPSLIAEQAWKMTLSGELWQHTSATMGRLLLGFVLGAVTGILAGLLMGVWRPVRAALGPTFTALYALPKIAIVPLLLLIFGLTETPKVLSVAISVFFVMQINTLAGIVQIDSRVLEAARAYKASGLKLFRYVLLPGATPAIMTGLRVAAGMSVIVITAVEFVASNNGLGYLIWNSWQLFQPSKMYVGLIVVSLVGAAVTALIILLERAALPWKYSSGSKKKDQK